MSNRTVRLLNSLKLLAQLPDGWLSRSTLADSEHSAVRQDDPTLDDAVDQLRRAFPLADDPSIDALATVCAPMAIEGGVALVLRGEPADAIYLVVAGLFGVYDETDNGDLVLLRRLAVGDLIGDIGCLTGARQTVTIRALRNSELLRISKQDLQAASAGCPGVLLALCSSVVQRLQSAPAAAAPFKAHIFCVVPAGPTIDLAPIMRGIAETLRCFGTVTTVPAEQTSGRPLALSDVEHRFDFVLLPADSRPTAWTRFCLRQCDRIVLVADGEAEPAAGEALGPDCIHVPNNTSLSLVLLWQGAILPARTAAWLRALHPAGHHHVRSAADVARAARLIAGRGCGLVLSGGGAKALAHLGVIDALRQHDIPIDAVGGTSIGAIVAAVFALEWDHAATVRSLAAAFSSRRFSDFALSRTALYSERVFTRTLGHCFGDREIEDTPIPFFCVSTNLTQGVSTAHRTGRLVTWLRAASAVPGICPPIMHQNTVYVDGGVLSNLPTDAVREFGVASVIGVDVGSCLDGPARSDAAANMPTILDLLWRVGTIGSDTAANRPPLDGDVILRPEVADIRLFEWDAHARAIAAGYQTALAYVPAIKAALSRNLA